MAERIASGEIHVEVNQAEAREALQSIQSDFDRTMQRIDAASASVTIEGDLAELRDAHKQATRIVRQLEAEHATVTLDADKAPLEKDIAEAKRLVKAIDGQVAYVEFKARGTENVLREQKRIADADRKASDERTKQVMREAKVASALNKQREREMAAAHGSALAMERERKRAEQDATVGVAQRTAKVIEMQRQYAKLTDQLERIDKKRPIGRESRAKVELDAAGIVAKMEALKAELNFLGAHPPVEIKADIDRRGLKRVTGVFTDFLTMIGNKASGLSDLTLRLGPFTTSIKGAATALGFLGPTLTDLVGAAGSLIGVLGAGIAGAAAVGGGALVGLGSAFLGLKFSSRNVGQEVTNVRAAINALQKAQEKYGDSSDKAKAKQKELNNTLKHVQPLAAQTALGIEKFYHNWDKHTETTRNNLGSMAKGGFEALNNITPMWAHATNNLSRILDRSLRGGFAYLSGSEFRSNFSQITDNFNAMVPTLLHGFGSLGRAAMNFAREGSKAFPMLSGGFDNFASRILHFTQANSFSATVHRWVMDARDIMRFFGAAARVVAHFFGDGSEAGDKFVNTMTNALNRWDEFLTSTEGKNKVGDYFTGAVKGTQELYAALAPLVRLFALWSIGLTPAVSMITAIFAEVTKLTESIGKLVGLSSPLATFGSTLGAVWAVSKIGGFVSMLARAVALMKELGAIGTLKSIASGGFLGKLRAGGLGAGVAEGGSAAAAEIRAAMITGGGAAAAEIRAAMGTGGAIGAAEGLILPKGLGRGAKELGTVEKAAGAATFAFAGLEGAAAVAATGGLALLAGAAVYGGYKLITMKSDADKARDAIKDVAKHSHDLQHAVDAYSGAAQNATQATRDYKTSTDSVNASKDRLAKIEAKSGRNSAAYRSELSNLNGLLQQRATDEGNVQKTLARQMILSGRIPALELARTKASEALNKAQENQAKVEEQLSKHAEERNGDAKRRADAQKLVNDALKAYRTQAAAAEAAMNTLAAGTINVKRQVAGMIPLTKNATQALGRLARQTGGKNVAMNIGLKFADPRDAQRAAQSASKAIKSGVSSNIVMKIVADSRDADDAVRKLQGARLARKVLKIAQEGGESVQSTLAKIIGRKLTAKEQRILEKGGGTVLQRLQRIIGLKLSPKTLAVLLRDLASSRIRTVQQLIAALHDKTVTLTVQERRVAGYNQKASKLPRATGGPTGGSPTDRAVDRATSSMLRGMLPTTATPTVQRGMKVSRPRVLVGEEPSHPEFVIATNPAHRKDNVRYLKQAAAALGVETAATGKAGTTGLGKFVGNTFQPNALTERHPAFKPSKGRKAKFAARRGWADYVENLQTRQSLWEREVSIRESAVREPKDMVIEGDPQIVTDPTTGEQVSVPTYIPNPKIESEYKPDVASVLDAMKNLMQIVAELVRTIPMAIQANRQERGSRNHAIETLNTEIEKEKHRAAVAKKPENKKKHEERISKLRDERDKHIDVNRTLREDEKTLVTDRIDAGMDYREEDIARKSYADEFATASGQATQDAADQTAAAIPQDDTGTAGSDAGTSDTAGSTGADTTMGIAEQTALTLSQNMDTLRNFGSNFIGAAGGAMAQFTPGPLGGAGVADPSTMFGATGGSLSAGAAVASALGSASGASMAASFMSATPTTSPMASAPASAAGDGKGDTTVSVVNNFATAPTDPLTWSKGVEFELQAAL